MDQEKVHATHAWESGAHLHDDFFLSLVRFHLTSDLYSAALASGAPLVDQWSLQCLVTLRDDLVHGELQVANIVMTLQVIHVVLVIDIVNVAPVVLALLKVVLHVEGLDPAGVQVVHDHLRHAQLLPLVSDLLREDHYAIRPRKRVKVRQVFRCKTDAHSLHEAIISRVDALVHGGQDGIVQVLADAAGALDGACVLMRAHARHAVTKCGSHT